MDAARKLAARLNNQRVRKLQKKCGAGAGVL